MFEENDFQMPFRISHLSVSEGVSSYSIIILLGGDNITQIVQNPNAGLRSSMIIIFISHRSHRFSVPCAAGVYASHQIHSHPPLPQLITYLILASLVASIR